MSSIRVILDRIKQKVGWTEIFALLIPFLEVLFAKILEQCTTTEDEAVDMVTDPSPWQMRYMHWQVRREMRREKSVPRRQRSARAWEVVDKMIQEANADPEAVAAAFNEMSR